MGLRFFADHRISNGIVKELLDPGHAVFRLRECIPVESMDPVVIAAAQDLDSILLSLDGDFTDKLNYPPENCKESLHCRSGIIRRLLPS
jgi:predicted nuclease of predicted toxin-antitoxin system